MKKALLLVGLLILVAMLTGCMGIGHSTDRSDRYDDGEVVAVTRIIRYFFTICWGIWFDCVEYSLNKKFYITLKV